MFHRRTAFLGGNGLGVGASPASRAAASGVEGLAAQARTRAGRGPLTVRWRSAGCPLETRWVSAGTRPAAVQRDRTQRDASGPPADRQRMAGRVGWRVVPGQLRGAALGAGLVRCLAGGPVSVWSASGISRQGPVAAPDSPGPVPDRYR